MGISVGQLAIIVLIVVLLFGTKKLKTLGSDLGESVKGFKKAMQDDESQKNDAEFKTSNIDSKVNQTSGEEIKSKDNERV